MKTLEWNGKHINVGFGYERISVPIPLTPVRYSPEEENEIHGYMKELGDYLVSISNLSMGFDAEEIIAVALQVLDRNRRRRWESFCEWLDRMAREGKDPGFPEGRNAPFIWMAWVENKETMAYLEEKWGEYWDDIQGKAPFSYERPLFPERDTRPHISADPKYYKVAGIKYVRRVVGNLREQISREKSAEEVRAAMRFKQKNGAGVINVYA